MVMESDISALKWLSEKGDINKELYFTSGYTHINAVYSNLGYFPNYNMNALDKGTIFIPSNQYILLIYANVVEKIGFGTIPKVQLFEYFNISDINPLIKNKSKIYNYGGSEILWSWG